MMVIALPKQNELKFVNSFLFFVAVAGTLGAGDGSVPFSFRLGFDGSLGAIGDDSD